jgi:hypothetical protein
MCVAGHTVARRPETKAMILQLIGAFDMTALVGQLRALYEAELKLAIALDVPDNDGGSSTALVVGKPSSLTTTTPKAIKGGEGGSTNGDDGPWGGDGNGGGDEDVSPLSPRCDSSPTCLTSSAARRSCKALTFVT